MRLFSLCVLLLSAHLLPAADWEDGNVTISLLEVLEKPGNHYSNDLDLEVAWRHGAIARSWCTSRDFGMGHHLVEQCVIEPDGNDLLLKATISLQSDGWSPTGSVTVVARIAGTAGDYQATVAFDGKDSYERGGRVLVDRRPAWPEKIRQVGLPGRGVHPRVLVRSEDLADLRTLAAEGHLIKMTAGLGRKNPAQGEAGRHTAEPGVVGKFTSWPAADLAAAYVWTGRKELADASAAALRPYVVSPDDPAYRTTNTQDIHHAPFILGMALALDGCWDAWDEAFRRQVIAALRQHIRNLRAGTFKGETMSGLNVQPWSNHNGIRIGALGVAAMVLVDELDEHGEPMPEMMEHVDYCAYEARDYLRYGVGESGWGMEGSFYKYMTLERGLLHFLHGYQQFTGHRIGSGVLGDWLTLGDWPRKKQPNGLGKIGGLTAMVTAGPDWQGTVRQMMIDGGQTFGAGTHGLMGVVAFAALPTEGGTEPIPWFLGDRQKGNNFARIGDLRFELNLLSDIRRACHWEKAGNYAAITLADVEGEWLNGRFMPAVPAQPHAFTANNGPKVLGIEEPASGVVQLRLDGSRQYLGQVLVEADKDKAVQTFVRYRNRPYYDFGIRAEGSLLLDGSGASGQPLVMAGTMHVTGVPAMKPSTPAPADLGRKLPPHLAKRMKKIEKPPTYWSLPLAFKAQTRQVDERYVVVTAVTKKDKALETGYLHCWSLGSRGITNGRLVEPDHDYRWVMVWSPEAELQATVHSREDGESRWQLAGRSLAFGPGRLVLEDR